MAESYYTIQKNTILQASKEDVIDLAKRASLDLLSFLSVDNEMEFEDAFYTLSLLCNIGLSNKESLNEDEAKLVDVIFSDYITGSSELLHPLFKSSVDDAHYDLLRNLNSLGKDAIFPILDLILCFSCINGTIDEQKDAILSKIYSTSSSNNA